MWRSARAAAILHGMPAFFSRESGRACRCAHFTDSRSPPAAASSASLPLAIAAIRKRLQHRTQLESAFNRTASCTSCSSSSDRLRSMLWREDGRIARRAHASRAEHGAGEKTPEQPPTQRPSLTQPAPVTTLDRAPPPPARPSCSSRHCPRLHPISNKSKNSSEYGAIYTALIKYMMGRFAREGRHKLKSSRVEPSCAPGSKKAKRRRPSSS